MSMIKVGIVDDQKLFRQGMTMILSNYDQFELILEAGDGTELLDKLDNGPKPDVILLDLKMKEMHGLDTTKRLKAIYPEIKIIILSLYYTDAFIVPMIELGVHGYLPKNCEPQEVEETITNVIENDFHFSPKVMESVRKSMLKKVRYRNNLDNIDGLREREMAILQLICQQKTTAEIADILFISARTVEGHRKKLLEKTGAKNTAGLVIYAILNNLYSPGENEIDLMSN